MRPKIIQAMKQTGSTWRKRWGVVSDSLTDWFDSLDEAEKRLRQVSKPAELVLSPL